MKLTALAFAASMAVIGHANAALSYEDPALFTDLGDFANPAGVSFSVFNAPTTPLSAFTNFFIFDITEPGTLIASAAKSDFSFSSIAAFNTAFYQVVGAIGGSDDILLGTASVDQVVAAGNYYLKVTGVAGATPGTIGGFYNADVFVAQVPEPETWAMLLAGVGLVGLQLRRKNQRRNQTAVG